MIRTADIFKKYHDKTVLDRVSIQIPKGKITSLIGANGAGKSTLLSIISHLSKGDGDVFIDDRPLASYSPAERSKKMATLRQLIHLQAKLTVRELIAFGRYPYVRSKLRAEDHQIVDSAIAYMALESLADAYIDEISGGERQRAFIAMIIAQDTEYILLDEPLNNLDMKHAVQIMKLLKRLVDEKKKTVVLVIHDINFAISYADHIIALKKGQLVGAGPTAEVATPEMLEKVYDMPFNIHTIDGNPICSYYI